MEYIVESNSENTYSENKKCERYCDEGVQSYFVSFLFPNKNCSELFFYTDIYLFK